MKKKEKWIKRSVLGSMAALAVMAVVGCAEEVTQIFSDSTKVEVTASFGSTDSQSLTRAADGLDNATSGFSLLTETNSGSKVRVMVDANDGNYSSYDYSITGTTAITAPATPPAFPSGVNSVNVYGWYPNVSLTDFSVNANQSSTANYCLSDLMVAAGDACTRSGSNVTHASALSFTHVMAKLKVSLTLASGVTVKAVKLKRVKPTVTVTPQLTSNAVTSFNLSEASGTATDITLLSGGSLTSASAAADKVLCGVFPPQEITSGALLEITANYNSGSDQTITYSLSAAKNFASANEYTMNISLSGTNVTTGTVSLGDWTGASGTVNITGGGGGGSVTLSSYEVTLQDGGSSTTVTATAGGSSYTAQSANTGVATVSVSSSTVTINPISAGTTQVIVCGLNGTTMNSSIIDVTVNPSAGTKLASITSSDVGKPVGADGSAYASLSSLTSAGTTCVGVLAYSGSTGHGLICALVNATSQTWNTINGWSNQTTQGFTGKLLPDAAARGSLTSYTTLGSTTVSNWMVLSKDNYTTMWNAFGNASNGTYNSTSNGYIEAAGGTACSGYYWSTTEYDGYDAAWVFYSGGWNGNLNKTGSYGVRPVLAF